MTKKQQLRKRRLALVRILAWLAAGAAAIDQGEAAVLTPAEETFVAAYSSTLVIGAKCPNVTVINGGAVSWGQSHGVDTDKLTGALRNAVNSMVHENYDRSKLIPEVTSLMNDTVRTIGGAVERNEDRACALWGEMLVKMGFIKRSD